MFSADSTRSSAAGRCKVIDAPGITVNGIKISPEQINAEVQYHPAETLPEAKYQAMQALVIRELLIQRAVFSCLCSRQSALEDPDAAIEKLLKREVHVPEPNREECERYYERNKDRFVTRPLFEASHILYPAPPEDGEARKHTRERASTALKKIHGDATLFESVAHAESACSSAKTGGFLGQITAGQTVPAFEAALLKMQEGEISKSPVETEVGYHIIRVHRRAEGKPLPRESVMGWIADYLRNESWQRAFRQYIQILAGQAEISGFRLKGVDSPLVQ